MRLLSEGEKRILAGDLSFLQISDDILLYFVDALPQVFRKASHNIYDTTRIMWLYVPYNELLSLQRSLMVEGSNPDQNYISRLPIKTDEQDIYPVLVNNRIVAVFTCPSGVKLNIDQKQIPYLFKTFSKNIKSGEKYDRVITDDFIAGLFHKDDSFSCFLKNTLHMIVRQYRECYCGIYYKQNDEFVLRMASGNIEYNDYLPGRPDPGTVREWVDLVRREQYHRPAELLPDNMVFLQNPPVFEFIHPGPKSDRTEYFIVVVYRSDIEFDNLRNIEQIASLTSQVHEIRFYTNIELFSKFTNLNPAKISQQTFNEELVELFKLLDDKVEISSLSFSVVPDGSLVVGKGQDGNVSVTSYNEVNIPDSILVDLKKENVLIRQVSNNAPNIVNDNTKSDIYLYLHFNDSLWGVLTISVPYKISNPEYFKKLVAPLGSYLAVYYGITLSCNIFNQSISVCQSDIDCERILGRFDTIKKLARGYFHHLFESLSVVVGQSDILNNVLTASGGETAGTVISKASGKISGAAEDISSDLRKLRDICDVDRDAFLKEKPCCDFLRELPDILKGFASQIRDTKNITLKLNLDISGEPDLVISFHDYLDYLLPFVLTLMEEAICSGVLKIFIEKVNNKEQIVFTFNKNIIGHTNLTELLFRVFNFHEIRTSGEGSGYVLFEGLILRYSHENEKNYRVEMIPKNEGHQDQPDQKKSTSGISK